jgi:tetratricopeptide (TPR) repeat protein
MIKGGGRTLRIALSAMLALVFSFQPQAQQASSPAPATLQAALSLFQTGRQLEMANKTSEAATRFTASLAMTETLLTSDPQNPDLLVLKAWNLFRLGHYKQVVSIAEEMAKTRKDYRMIETEAEAMYFLGNNEEALDRFTKYFSMAPSGDNRMSSAYYFAGETYIRLRMFEHADIALATATQLEPSMYYWWFRLGNVKEILGHYKKAYDAYGKSYSLNTGFTAAKDGQDSVKAKSGL